jgi:hypothetical protein
MGVTGITDEDRLLISDVILEGMVAGLFESCELLRLSAFGEKIVGPFKPVLDTAVRREACEMVFHASNATQLTQESFLLCFMRLLEKANQPGAQPIPVFDDLAKRLDSEGEVARIKRLVCYLGVRFLTLFCLMALYVKEQCRSEKYLIQEGTEVRMAT